MANEVRLLLMGFVTFGICFCLPLVLMMLFPRAPLPSCEERCESRGLALSEVVVRQGYSDTCHCVYPDPE